MVTAEPYKENDSRHLLILYISPYVANKLSLFFWFNEHIQDEPSFVDFALWL